VSGTLTIPLCPDCRRTLPIVKITLEQWQILQYKTGVPIKHGNRWVIYEIDNAVKAREDYGTQIDLYQKQQNILNS